MTGERNPNRAHVERHTFKVSVNEFARVVTGAVSSGCLVSKQTKRAMVAARVGGSSPGPARGTLPA